MVYRLLMFSLTPGQRVLKMIKLLDDRQAATRAQAVVEGESIVNDLVRNLFACNIHFLGHDQVRLVEVLLVVDQAEVAQVDHDRAVALVLAHQRTGVIDLRKRVAMALVAARKVDQRVVNDLQNLGRQKFMLED